MAEPLVLVMHPASYDECVRALAERGLALVDREPSPLYGIRIQTDRNVPRRRLREVWSPPVDPFVQYEPADEAWLRPAGLGRVRQVDDGPYIMAMPGVRSLAAWPMVQVGAGDVLRPNEVELVLRGLFRDGG